MYVVKEVLKVVDGDTVDIIIDLGFSISLRQRVRIKGINSPETRTNNVEEKIKGMGAKVFAEQWFAQSGVLTVKTYKDEKYGRLLGEFFRGTENYSETAISQGFAVSYDGGSRKEIG